MPLRLYARLRLAFPVIWALCLLNFLPRDSTAARRVGSIALVAFVGMGALGALLGLVFLFTGVRFRCPFCGRWGAGNIESHGLPAMDCGFCGEVRCLGFLGLRIVKGAPPPAGGC